jgi:GNAT superfamily N-acetyltransferase
MASARHGSGDGDLAAVHSRISQLHAESPPALIREVHLELLRALGRSIGFSFHEQMPLEQPTDDLIIVQGRFNRRAHGREFGLHLVTEELEDGHLGRVAWMIELYLPVRCRRQGVGTALMEALLQLWERVGVGEARATTVGDGQSAFPSWGFAADPRHPSEDGLLSVRQRLPRGAQAQDRIPSQH